MAINRYRLTSTVTVAAGTLATVVAGEPGTGGPAGYGNSAVVAGTWADLKPQTFLKGQDIMLDPAGELYAAIGGGNLVQLTGGPESGTSGGHYGTSN